MDPLAKADTLKTIVDVQPLFIFCEYGPMDNEYETARKLLKAAQEDMDCECVGNGDIKGGK